MRVRCEDCGYECDQENWTPEFECPICHKQATAPMADVEAPTEAAPSETWIDDAPKATGGWKNNPIIGVAAIVLIAGAWVGMGSRALKKPAVERIEVVSMCVECDKKFENFTDELPMKCGECGKRKGVNRAYQCRGGGPKEVEGEKCDNVFTFTPPKSPSDPYSSKDFSDLSPEEQQKIEMEFSEKQMQWEEKMMKAQMCPKCESTSTSVVYTEAQKKRFEEWRSKRKK